MSAPTPHQLIILDRSGHREVTWTEVSPQTVDLAARAFRELQAMGYLLEACAAEGAAGQHLLAFDATAPRIVAHPPLVGG